MVVGGVVTDAVDELEVVATVVVVVVVDISNSFRHASRSSCKSAFSTATTIVEITKAVVVSPNATKTNLAPSALRPSGRESEKRILYELIYFARSVLFSTAEF